MQAVAALGAVGLNCLRRRPRHMAASGKGAATRDVRELLDAPIRVGLTDGRVVVGCFSCLDKQFNLLLTNAREMRWVQSGAADAECTERHLGTVLVPRRWVTSCYTGSVPCEA